MNNGTKRFILLSAIAGLTVFGALLIQLAMPRINFRIFFDLFE